MLTSYMVFDVYDISDVYYSSVLYRGSTTLFPSVQPYCLVAQESNMLSVVALFDQQRVCL